MGQIHFDFICFQQKDIGIDTLVKKLKFYYNELSCLLFIEITDFIAQDG